MASETRVGLLIGLMFIVAFGLVLSELTSPTPSQLAPAQQQLTRQNIWTPTAMPILPSREEVTIEPVSVQIAQLPEPTSSQEFVFVAVEETSQPQVAVLAAVLTDSNELNTAPANPKRHTVKSGDSLARIAKHYYGSERKYTLIYQANKADLADESLLQVGQVLLIPAISDSTGQGNNRQMGLGELAQRFGSDSPQTRQKRIYVVRQGDNLTRIARKVFNDDSRSAVKRLFDANRDKMPSPDALEVGTRLEIPS